MVGHDDIAVASCLLHWKQAPGVTDEVAVFQFRQNVEGGSSGDWLIRTKPLIRAGQSMQL